MDKTMNAVPDGLTAAEIGDSVCELGNIVPDCTKDYEIVVIGAGASGVPAAGTPEAPAPTTTISWSSVLSGTISPSSQHEPFTSSSVIPLGRSLLSLFMV